jgi:hypothetical protein
MNALELANYIEDEYLNDMECEHGFLVFQNGGCPNEGCKRQDFYKSVTMLRQQQAEIEELKSRELTDEEIEELIWNTTDMKDFARAILRKAQEK